MNLDTIKDALYRIHAQFPNATSVEVNIKTTETDERSFEIAIKNIIEKTNPVQVVASLPAGIELRYTSLNFQNIGVINVNKELS